MKLYHGSNAEINAIDLSRGRQGNDFGKGFYTNPDSWKNMFRLIGRHWTNSTNQTPLPRSKTLKPDYIIKVRYMFSISSKRNFLYDYQIES